MTNQLTLTPVANYHNACGENPLWDIQRKQLFWTDIPTGRMFSYTPASRTGIPSGPGSGKHEQIYSGPTVGGFTFQANGDLLLFRDTDIAVMRSDRSVKSVIKFADHHKDDVPRFNDCVADPLGRVFAGTMGKNDRGGIWLLDLDGSLTNLWRGTNCSNGMAFTSDLRTFYWTCTTHRTIYAFDYDPRNGSLDNRRVFLNFDGKPGAPDGLTIDSNGNLYSANYGDHGIFIFSPAGKLLDKIEMPAKAITSCVFGGPNLDELYATTAQGKPDDPPDTPAGTLYRVTGLRARGLPEFRSNIRV